MPLIAPLLSKKVETQDAITLGSRFAFSKSDIQAIQCQHNPISSSLDQIAFVQAYASYKKSITLFLDSQVKSHQTVLIREISSYLSAYQSTEPPSRLLRCLTFSSNMNIYDQSTQLKQLNRLLANSDCFLASLSPTDFEYSHKLQQLTSIITNKWFGHEIAKSDPSARVCSIPASLEAKGIRNVHFNLTCNRTKKTLKPLVLLIENFEPSILTHLNHILHLLYEINKEIPVVVVLNIYSSLAHTPSLSFHVQSKLEMRSVGAVNPLNPADLFSHVFADTFLQNESGPSSKLIWNFNTLNYLYIDFIQNHKSLTLLRRGIRSMLYDFYHQRDDCTTYPSFQALCTHVYEAKKKTRLAMNQQESTKLLSELAQTNYAYYVKIFRQVLVFFVSTKELFQLAHTDFHLLMILTCPVRYPLLLAQVENMRHTILASQKCSKAICTLLEGISHITGEYGKEMPSAAAKIVGQEYLYMEGLKHKIDLKGRDLLKRVKEKYCADPKMVVDLLSFALPRPYDLPLNELFLVVDSASHNARNTLLLAESLNDELFFLSQDSLAAKLAASHGPLDFVHVANLVLKAGHMSSTYNLYTAFRKLFPKLNVDETKIRFDEALSALVHSGIIRISGANGELVERLYWGF